MTQDAISFAIALILSSFFVVMILTGWVRSVLIKRAVMDIPNDRSSHKVPVPRGGGWAIMMVLLPTLAGAAVFIDADMRHTGLIAAVFILAAISWIDDRHQVNPAIRLGMHILAAYLGSCSFTPQEVLFGGALPLWLDRAVMILGWAWFINLYNFMDGIDGITGCETIAIATGLCFVTMAAGFEDSYASFISLILTGACLGFLAHNWHPAKIFLGDIGSVPLGYLSGFLLLSLAVKGYGVAAFILPLYYLVDSGITITWRAIRGEKVWQAHREHFYQKAALGAGSHDKVVIPIIIANLSLIAAATYSVSRPLKGLELSILIVAILLGKMHKTATQRKAKNS